MKIERGGSDGSLCYCSLEICKSHAVFFPRQHEIVRTELRIFGDASEEANAAVTYTRSLYSDGTVLVRLVKSSTKLAPAKIISIPKLKLNAALLARQASYIQKALV